MTLNTKSVSNIQQALASTQRTRLLRSGQLKGNQELNDELETKANELEKLFAEITKLSAFRKHVETPIGSPVPRQSFDDDSRGKLYDTYMKKRDARLTELWDSDRVEKEARMEAMYDVLERHSNEMKARLLWSSARLREERIRSFNAQSALKREEPLDFGLPQGKLLQPRTTAAAIPRSRRQQPDNNPLAQSVPTKAATRSQLRNYTRSRSTNEENLSVKEDKSRRSRSLRKSSVTSLESSEDVVSKQSKNMEPKRSLKKNTTKLKASMAPSEAMNKEEEDEKTETTDSYTQEASDVESPITSPASWNLNAARMRKKWGITQKPNLFPNSSDVQSRKDMTKGFKRLLNFGRKSRYAENSADYISATTSEGDDDTEDGRDLRKSRMGYSHGITESDFHIDEVDRFPSSIPTPPASFRLRDDHLSGSSIKGPRSFFSLSTFRSKGSE